MQDMYTIKRVNEMQNRETDRLFEEFLILAHESADKRDFIILLEVEQRIKDILITNGIFLQQFRDISDDCK